MGKYWCYRKVKWQLTCCNCIMCTECLWAPVYCAHVIPVSVDLNDWSQLQPKGTLPQYMLATAEYYVLYISTLKSLSNHNSCKSVLGFLHWFSVNVAVEGIGIALEREGKKFMPPLLYQCSLHYTIISLEQWVRSSSSMKGALVLSPNQTNEDCVVITLFHNNSTLHFFLLDSLEISPLKLSPPYTANVDKS